VIGAPIVEEIMYRMLLQTALIQACRNAWTGIALTSVLFALSHLGGGAVPWHATIPLFVLSVGLGVLQVRTGRVGPCIVVHMVFNAVNVGLTLAAR
jgi:membrane protease YdiL (CAAX protease family)